MNKGAFTLVELIVVITILAILGTISYLSFFGIQILARDAVRSSDLTNIAKSIELFNTKQGRFPVVTDPINVTFSGTTLWQQGSFGSGSWQDVKIISEIPRDPSTGDEYAYSTTQITGEYQVGSIIEGTFASLDQGNIFPRAHANTLLTDYNSVRILGNYNGKFIAYREVVSPTLSNIYVLGVPSILSDEISDIELSQLFLNNSFVLDGQKIAPSTYSGSLNTIGATWNFNPDIQTDQSDTPLPNYIIYRATVEEFSDIDGKTKFVTNLVDYYDTTPVADTPAFQELDNLSPQQAIKLVNIYVNGFGVGGLGEEFTGITQTDASGLSNSNIPAVTICVFGSSNFDECSFQ